jgi:hypothetical protein
MPRSRAEGKKWICEHILEDEPESVLDVGAGAGTYSELLRSKLSDSFWTAVEIFEPYAFKFELRDKYDRVVVGDFLNADVEPHDVVILGDVLEHVDKAQALEMWARARKLARATVYLCLPLDHYEQGPVNGNPHEEHKHHWSHDEVLADLDGIIESWKGPRKGCYCAIGLA